MSASNEEQVAQIKHQMEELKNMQDEVSYDLIDPKKSKQSAALKSALLSKFLGKFGKVGDAVVRVGEQFDLSHTSLSHGFHIGGIVLAAIDFVRIPSIYLMAFIMKEKVPVTLNRNAKWFYSAILLGLVITAVAAPVTAPFIAVIAASIALAVTVFLLAKILNERYQLNRQSKQLKRELQLELNEMDLIQKEAAHLQKSLGEAHKEEDIAAIYQKIAILKERFDSQKRQVESLKNKQLNLEEKINALKTVKILDRGVGVLLASTTIVALIVAIFFPPIGWAILTGVTVAAISYVTVRIGVPLIQMLGKWIKSKFEKTEAKTEESVSEEVALEKEQVHETTADFLTGLGMKTDAKLEKTPKHSESSDEEEDFDEHPHKERFIDDPIFSRLKSKINGKSVSDPEEPEDHESEHP